MYDLNNAIVKANNIAAKAWEAAKIQFANTDKASRLGNIPKIYWKKIGFNTAGKYEWNIVDNSDSITMNINFLSSADAEEFIESTTKHEIAHAIAHRVYHENGHGRAWKLACIIVGDDGNRCHNYAAPANSNKRCIKCCKCGQTYEFSPIRIKRAKEGAYRCGNCHENLKTFIFN